MGIHFVYQFLAFLQHTLSEPRLFGSLVCAYDSYFCLVLLNCVTCKRNHLLATVNLLGLFHSILTEILSIILNSKQDDRVFALQFIYHFSHHRTQEGLDSVFSCLDDSMAVAIIPLFGIMSQVDSKITSSKSPLNMVNNLEVVF